MVLVFFLCKRERIPVTGHDDLMGVAYGSFRQLSSTGACHFHLALVIAHKMIGAPRSRITRHVYHRLYVFLHTSDSTYLSDS